MGEVLRAIMDHNCIDARPAFYSTAGVAPVINTGTLTVGPRQARLQCKADSYFLLMTATMDCANANLAAFAWSQKSSSQAFQIVRASNGEAFQIEPQMMPMQNHNLNNLALWSEYALFEPAELIIINEIAWVTSPSGPNFTQYAFVTLVGIEYQMPPGSWGKG